MIRTFLSRGDGCSRDAGSDPVGPGSGGKEPLAVRANAALPAEDETGSFEGRRSRGETSQGLGSRRSGSPVRVSSQVARTRSAPI